MLKRTAGYTGLSHSTITKIINEKNRGEISSPTKHQGRAKSKTNLDEFDASAVRRTIYDMCQKSKKHFFLFTFNTLI